MRSARILAATAVAFVASGLLATPTAFAQHEDRTPAHNGYAEMQTREIKALSPEQVADLREGKGMGASLPAELNGVPGPLHVLQLKARINVTPEQQRQLETISAEMKVQARRLGDDIVAAEAGLDRAFRTGKADETLIQSTTARIAGLQGQLRAVHLMAHLKTRQVLSEQQVVAYNQARGYAVEHQHVH